MLRLLFSIVLSLALGYLLIGCLLRTPPHHTFNRLMKFSLGTGLGLGISSGIYFVGLLVFTPSGDELLFFDTSIHMGMICGLFLILILLVYFKLHIAPDNDLVSGQNVAATLSRISHLSRYGQISAAFFKEMLAFDRWQVYPPLLAGYLAVAGITRRPVDRFTGLSILAVLLTVLCGFFCVYLVTPHDLHWHLRTALHRLLLQVWPATVLMVFFLVRKRCPKRTD